MKLDITGSHYDLPEKDDDESPYDRRTMSIEYYLANNKSKSLFELGKNGWFICDDFRFKSDLENYLYLDTLKKYITETYRNCFLETDTTLKDIKYLNWLSTKIFEFTDGFDLEKDISYCNDCDDSHLELKENGYILVGSRYYFNDPIRYNEYIIERNLHSASYYKNIKINKDLLKYLTPEFSLKKYNSLLLLSS